MVKGRQYSVYTVSEMNSTDQLSISVVDENNMMLQSQHKLDSTVQIGRGMHTRIACMNAIVSMRTIYSAS